MICYEEIKTVHIELTNRCQASCPMCDRNFHGLQTNDNILLNEWRIQDFRKAFKKQFLIGKHLYLCGNFGDPMICKDILRILRYVQPYVSLEIHTNGSMHNTKYWKHLVKYLPKNHKVVFAIDGLADTHQIYRIGTDYNKVIDNAKAFIQAGGRAVWSFIRFKHNQHQVESAFNLSKKLGFVDFYSKDSSRFAFDNKFPVLDRKGKYAYSLEPSTDAKHTQLTQQQLDNLQHFVDNTKISCAAQHSKEIYVDTHMNLFPCCFLAAIPYQPYEDEKLTPARNKILQQYKTLIKDIGNNNIKENTIESIVNSEAYQTVWKKYWTIEKLWTCARTCGDSLLSPSEQINNANKAIV